MPPAPLPLPDLDLPKSQNTVTVSIIDTTSRLKGIPVSRFLTPELPGFKTFDCPAHSFLIEHGATNTRVIFDLGVRKDTENLSAALKKLLSSHSTMDASASKNVADILEEHDVKLGSIRDIIWSHRHFDHTGDPSTFPPSTNLVVGPGFKEKNLPGYPADEEATCSSSAWEGRELVELDFATDSRRLKVGKYAAVDYFGDGSFYLLQTPGHTNDHVCGFARVKADGVGTGDFILMGGDCAHQGGEFRPSAYEPIPETVRPDIRLPAGRGGHCPGEIFAQLNVAHEGDDKWNKRFFQPQSVVADNVDEARSTLDVLEEFDAQENIFVIFAHDNTLADIVDYFPKPATEWRQEGWKQEARWRFMNELKQAADGEASKT